MRRYSAGARKLLTQPVRWNSTAEAVSNHIPEPPVNSPPPAQLRVQRTGGPPFPRRQNRPTFDDNSPYVPNLDLIAATAAKGSLASRLAQRATGMKIESAPSPELTDSTTKPDTVSDETRDATLARQREFLEARRAERLARSSAQPAAAPVHTDAPSTPPSFAIPVEDPEAATIRRREILLARRAERVAREAASSPRKYLQPQTPNRPKTQTARSESERSAPLIIGGLAVKRRQNCGHARGARGGRGGKQGGRPRRNREDELEETFPSEINEWLESEDIQLAGSLAPEIRWGDLNRAFRPREKLGASKPDGRAVRETLGGDYSLFTPRNPQHFVSSARKLGPIQHSSVILSHNKHLPVGTRLHVKDLVGTAVRPP
ncbi:hypothetical protein B0H11DRAFT_2060442 [Mycena galericulata]|nr:hypothetical protein B0H11DRAFT_2060442 [Mycena galericulata]